MEVKKEVKLEEKKSNLALESRKKLSLNGVIEVISFDEEKILLNTCLGMLTVKGQGLKMNKLDVQNGDILIVGNIDSFVYTSTQPKKDSEGIFKRLFK
ncbi:sporulation protein YabP [Clostridium amylolyticum]|uniref:Sporulation protein YabP n=1 Tax=Clostridium amylolyticum TaxID=1121298 RepID=A0A1M6LHV0_9CLOT|nr:sporulation protein YabP [Clostridium amylolyticum]SHJ70776.1 sporulation protein YabP [Clostridium amylolyticum]